MSRLKQYGGGGKDLYKILRITHLASIQDIKLSYKAIAMEIHPDMNNNCPKMVEQFKELNEAYAILKDTTKRREYDMKRYGSSTNTSTGATGSVKPPGWVNKNRKSPLPKDYRKVYVSRPPPPEWRSAWDHELHNEMHYGQGFRKQAIRDAINEARVNGEYEYRSPLGKGFTFAYIDDHERVKQQQQHQHKTDTTSSYTNTNGQTKRDESTTSSSSTGNQSTNTDRTGSSSSSSSHRQQSNDRQTNHQQQQQQTKTKQQQYNNKQQLFDENGHPLNVNPYSRYKRQGPSHYNHCGIEYEEWEVSDQTKGKMMRSSHYREKIINELHTSRNGRIQQQQQQQHYSQHQQQKTQQHQQQQQRIHNDLRYRIRSMEEKKRNDEIRKQRQRSPSDTNICVIL